MKATLMVIVAIMCLGLWHGQADAQDRLKLTQSPTERAKPHQLSPADKAKIPEPYLSIGEFYARRDPNAQPPRIRVAGFYHNYTRQTVSGATFSIERWNGTGWTTLKSGPLNAIAPNKPGAESLDLPPSDAAMKFRFVISKSVEGSKEYQLPALVGTRTKLDPKLDPKSKATPATSPTDKVKNLPSELRTPPIIVAKVAIPYLSMDRVYVGRFAANIIVRAELSNPNMKAVSGAEYIFERFTDKGWTVIKTAKFPTVASRGTTSVYAEVPMSYDAIKFRLRVAQSVEGTKECALPQRLFVVQYRCPDWQVYASFEQESNYLGTSPRDRSLRELGFNTRIKDTYHDNFFDQYHTITLSYRIEGLRERAFSTPAAARSFQASLPTQGVASSIVER